MEGFLELRNLGGECFPSSFDLSSVHQGRLETVLSITTVAADVVFFPTLIQSFPSYLHSKRPRSSGSRNLDRYQP